MALEDILVNNPEMAKMVTAIVDHATQQLNQSVDRALTGVDERIAVLMTQLTNELSGVIQGIQAIEDKAVADIHGIVDRLNGVSVAVSVPPKR
jgi:hypothetical protein